MSDDDYPEEALQSSMMALSYDAPSLDIEEDLSQGLNVTVTLGAKKRPQEPNYPREQKAKKSVSKKSSVQKNRQAEVTAAEVSQEPVTDTPARKKCPKCKKKFTNISNHLRKSTACRSVLTEPSFLKERKCRFCHEAGFRFQTVRDTKRHYRKLHDSTCSECFEKFHNARDREEHEIDVHRILYSLDSDSEYENTDASCVDSQTSSSKNKAAKKVSTTATSSSSNRPPLPKVKISSKSSPSKTASEPKEYTLTFLNTLPSSLESLVETTTIPSTKSPETSSSFETPVPVQPKFPVRLCKADKSAPSFDKCESLQYSASNLEAELAKESARILPLFFTQPAKNTCSSMVYESNASRKCSVEPPVVNQTAGSETIFEEAEEIPETKPQSAPYETVKFLKAKYNKRSLVVFKPPPEATLNSPIPPPANEEVSDMPPEVPVQVNWRQISPGEQRFIIKENAPPTIINPQPQPQPKIPNSVKLNPNFINFLSTYNPKSEAQKKAATGGKSGSSPKTSKEAEDETSTPKQPSFSTPPTDFVTIQEHQDLNQKPSSEASKSIVMKARKSVTSKRKRKQEEQDKPLKDKPQVSNEKLTKRSLTSILEDEKNQHSTVTEPSPVTQKLEAVINPESSVNSNPATEKTEIPLLEMLLEVSSKTRADAATTQFHVPYPREFPAAPSGKSKPSASTDKESDPLSEPSSSSSTEKEPESSSSAVNYFFLKNNVEKEKESKKVTQVEDSSKKLDKSIAGPQLETSQSQRTVSMETPEDPRLKKTKPPQVVDKPSVSIASTSHTNNRGVRIELSKPFEVCRVKKILTEIRRSFEKQEPKKHGKRKQFEYNKALRQVLDEHRALSAVQMKRQYKKIVENTRIQRFTKIYPLEHSYSNYCNALNRRRGIYDGSNLQSTSGVKSSRQVKYKVTELFETKNVSESNPPLPTSSGAKIIPPKPPPLDLYQFQTPKVSCGSATVPGFSPMVSKKPNGDPRNRLSYCGSSLSATDSHVESIYTRATMVTPTKDEPDQSRVVVTPTLDEPPVEEPPPLKKVRMNLVQECKKNKEASVSINDANNNLKKFGLDCTISASPNEVPAKFDGQSPQSAPPPPMIVPEDDGIEIVVDLTDSEDEDDCQIISSSSPDCDNIFEIAGMLDAQVQKRSEKTETEKVLDTAATRKNSISKMGQIGNCCSFRKNSKSVAGSASGSLDLSSNSSNSKSSAPKHSRRESTSKNEKHHGSGSDTEKTSDISNPKKYDTNRKQNSITLSQLPEKLGNSKSSGFKVDTQMFGFTEGSTSEEPKRSSGTDVSENQEETDQNSEIGEFTNGKKQSETAALKTLNCAANRRVTDSNQDHILKATNQKGSDSTVKNYSKTELQKSSDSSAASNTVNIKTSRITEQNVAVSDIDKDGPQPGKRCRKVGRQVPNMHVSPVSPAAVSLNEPNDLEYGSASKQKNQLADKVSVTATESQMEKEKCQSSPTGTRPTAESSGASSSHHCHLLPQKRKFPEEPQSGSSEETDQSEKETSEASNLSRKPFRSIAWEDKLITVSVCNNFTPINPPPKSPVKHLSSIPVKPVVINRRIPPAPKPIIIPPKLTSADHCELCEKEYERVDEHLARCHSPTPCKNRKWGRDSDYCCGLFFNKYNYGKHRKRYHQAPSPDSPDHQCNKCKQKFPHYGYLIDHLVYEHDICSKPFMDVASAKDKYYSRIRATTKPTAPLR